MTSGVSQRVGKIRWIFLPLGLCALAAVGAHAAADLVGDRVLAVVDGVDAFFDAIFSHWSLTAPLVELVGLTQRTWFARALALTWELAADALLAIPLLNYQERAAAEEVQLARTMLRPPARMVRPLAMLFVGAAGARAVARMAQASLLHFAVIGRLTALVLLLALLFLLVPRAVFRSLESAPSGKRAWLELILLAPLALAAVVSL